MDELTLIREFRSQVPSAPAERRRSAREALVAHSERTGRLDVLRRRPVLTAAVLVLLAGLVTGSALGLGERLLDLIRGKPAPPSVQREFVRMLGNRGAVIPYFDFPKVIKSRIHGVLVFRTSAGPVALWAGPTRGGDKVCFILRKLRPRNFGERVPLLAACGAPGPPAGKSAVASWDSAAPSRVAQWPSSMASPREASLPSRSGSGAASRDAPVSTSTSSPWACHQSTQMSRRSSPSTRAGTRWGEIAWTSLPRSLRLPSLAERARSSNCSTSSGAGGRSTSRSPRPREAASASNCARRNATRPAAGRSRCRSSSSPSAPMGRPAPPSPSSRAT